MPLNLFHNSHNNLQVKVQRRHLQVQREMQLKMVREQVETPGLTQK